MSRLVIGAALLALAGVARADVDSELVQAGLQAYESLDYARCLATLGRALTEESLTREEKVAAYRTRALCAIGAGRIEEARADFERVLTIDPKLELDRRASARARAVFEEARGRLATGAGQPAPAHRLPSLEPQVTPARPREGEPVRVTVTHAGGLGRALALYHRVRGEVTFRRLEDASDDGRFGVVLPGEAVRPPALEYYAVVADAAGIPVARAGSLGAVLSLEVRPRPVPVHRRRWFWGVIGGVAAAGLAAGVIAAATLTAPATVTILPR